MHSKMMPEGGTDLAVFDALDIQKEDSLARTLRLPNLSMMMIILCMN